MRFLSCIVTLSVLSLTLIDHIAAQNTSKPTASELNFPAETSQQQVLDGWIGLFDGKTTFGWTASNLQNWEANPTTGELRTEGKGKSGLIHTTAQFDDFELHLEFKAGAKTNSGVFIRTNPKPKSAARDCYEINIAATGTHDYTTGAIVARTKTDVQVSTDQWHMMKIKAQGDRIQVWVDDQPTADFKDPKPLGLGYIGLQAKTGAVSFRNIRLKPLSQKPLFDGTDLSNWNTDQSMASKFSVTKDGELSVINGKGQLESKDKFANFVLSFQCKTNAPSLNSGMFFRCIPGDVMNGYESQIQNGIKNGDRSDPEDCGTGGIFRRANARVVNANDQQWFATTIITTGPRIGVWVNGLQVTDWVDKRKPNENPRRGYRAAAGTLTIQGHDPTTDLLFRQIQVHELSKRRP